MLRKHLLATLAVAAGFLAASGPASASSLVLYNGHAGLAAAKYQHDQTDQELLASPDAAVSDTSKNEISIETIERRWLPEIGDEVL